MPTDIRHFPAVSLRASYETDQKMLRQVAEIMFMALFITTIIVGFAVFCVGHDDSATGETKTASRGDVTAYCAEPGSCVDPAAP